ncbi:MAG: RNHCP domain-containing protein [Patescibacteria group bacterium]|nr:RNHCP domain-containing protein [Patescibacteria group bacterium]
MAIDFIKKQEDFTCEHCGVLVEGSGYTNHCPHCLWSKHVDINPGDRAADCGGLMPPVGYESEDGTYTLTHRCETCGHEKRNKVSSGDDLALLAGL